MGIALEALPHLDAGDFRLRPWAIDDRDLALLREASRDPLIPPASSVPAHGADDELRAYMERNLARLVDGAGCQFVIDDLSERRPIGSITILDDGRNRGRASIGYWVVPTARKRGAALAALRALVAWARDGNWYPRLEIYVQPTNVGSVRTAERAGFQHEGLMRSWQEIEGERRDFLLYSLIAGDPLP